MLLFRFTLIFLFITSSYRLAANPSISCTKLSKNELNLYFKSNNPLKKMLFSNEYQAYTIIIANPSPNSLILQSSKFMPRPINPLLVSQKLSQSISAAPWLCGIGWGIFATKIIGLALIPSVLLGATIIIAGVIGMHNHSLPQSTRHTITHQLIDGIHDYQIDPYNQAKFIVILPHTTDKQLVIKTEKSSLSLVL